MDEEEAAADSMLVEAESIAKKQNFEVEGEILHAREAGPAIVDEAIERQADLILLGTGYDDVFGQYHLGRVVQYTLRNAPCEVWVCRHAVEE
jgi:nucleotide-binding universal stress UspA family protein